MAKTKAKTAKKQTKTAGRQASKPAAKTKSVKTPVKKTAAKTKSTSKKKSTAKSASINQLSANVVGLTEDVKNNMLYFISLENIAANLTPTQRRRLHSAGVRNYGFIDKAFDIARENPDLMPSNLNISQLNGKLRDLEDLRQLMFILQKFLQLATDSFMLQSDACYTIALRIYRILQEQARSNIPGSVPLFNALRTFFNRPRRTGSEPTEKQIEKDIKALLHGKADGEIIIANERPKVSGGTKKVIDNVSRSKAAVKETVEASIKE